MKTMKKLTSIFIAVAAMAIFSTNSAKAQGGGGRPACQTLYYCIGVTGAGCVDAAVVITNVTGNLITGTQTCPDGTVNIVTFTIFAGDNPGLVVGGEVFLIINSATGQFLITRIIAP